MYVIFEKISKFDGENYINFATAKVVLSLVEFHHRDSHITSIRVCKAELNAL
jgi:hypothetical protein